MAEVELSDGGVMEFDPEDGTIRYRDQHGNCENIWRVGDPDYEATKQQYFADEHLSIDSDDGFDEFLQDACLSLREMWESRGGAEIGEMELQSLNDLLSDWFSDKWE